MTKDQKTDSPLTPIAADALESITRADIRYELVRKEIPSDLEGYRHFEVSLRLDKAPDMIFLARLRELIKPDQYTPNYGFDEETLRLEWLNPSDLLHVSWRTCRMGQGTNTMQTHLLLQKKAGRWVQIYRDSHEFYSREGVFIRYRFEYEPQTKALSIREEDCSGPNRESRSSPPDPTSVTLTARNVIYLTDWHFQLTDGHLQFTNGTKNADLDDRTFYLYDPESETHSKHDYDIHSVAKFLAPKDPDAMLARIRKLNPTLKTSDTCSGVVLFDTDVKWRGADEKHYYTMPE